METDFLKIFFRGPDFEEPHGGLYLGVGLIFGRLCTGGGTNAGVGKELFVSVRLSLAFLLGRKTKPDPPGGPDS